MEFVIFLKNIVKQTISIGNDPKNEPKHIIYLDANNLYGLAMSKFLIISTFKGMDPKEFDLNKYSSNSLKGCVLEVVLEYLKDSRELLNNYPLVPDKIEGKREIFTDYHLKFANHYNITTIKKCLTLVIIQLNQNIIIIQAS